MSQRRRLLVTGGTGFLGKHVVRLLREKAEVDVISRSTSTEVQADLLSWNGGLDVDSLKNRNYDALIHMAGLYDLSASPLDVFKNNIAATSTALRICNLLGIPVFLNTSSIAAATNLSRKSVRPFDVDFTKPFHDSYAESKALTEQQIKNWLGPLRLKINLRLGILVGDSKEGLIERIDGPYHAARVFKRLKPWISQWNWPLVLPGHPDVRLPLVPVDKAAQAIVRMIEWGFKTSAVGYQSFHIVPTEGLPVKKLYESTLKQLKIKHSGIKLISQIPETLAAKFGSHALGFPEEQLRYALSLPLYSSADTRRILGNDWCPEFDSYEKTFWSGYEKHLSHR